MIISVKWVKREQHGSLQFLHHNRSVQSEAHSKAAIVIYVIKVKVITG